MMREYVTVGRVARRSTAGRFGALVASSLACAVAMTCLTASPAMADVTSKGRLESGEGLQIGEKLTSRMGQFQLVMQPDGNLVEYVGARGLWHTQTWGRPGTVARMQTDGNFVLYAPGFQAVWSSRTYGNPGAHLVLKDDASLNVVSRSGTVLWSSGAVDSQLDPSRKLQVGWFLQSPDVRYRLIMQTDGNLVLYQRPGYNPIWHSQTYGNPGAEVVMQSDGNLVIYAPGRGAIWGTRTAGRPGTILRVEDTGRLVLYAPGRVPIWSSAPSGEYVIEDRDDIAEVKSVAFQMATDRGWGASAQLNCIDQLFQRESGWRWNADNPYSSAYGIPQALPGSKMATEGADWRDNPVTQIKWGYTYIDDRYGTPCGAWNFWLEHGWYREPAEATTPTSGGVA